jgi:mRNA-degrading endonuclease toxin of MazEF toxin-antitoxin module
VVRYGVAAGETLVPSDAGGPRRAERPAPVLVVSTDGFNAIDSWRSVIVIPCSTSDRQRARGPTAVPLRKGAGGLRKGSVAVCHQITTLDRDKLITRWGALGADDLAAVEAGILAALDL